MELRQLQYMVACAQTQSFSRAATILYTSQSNVSKTIAALEKELGKQLFIRRQHGIELTEKGKQVYQYAISMMECSTKIMECVEEETKEELRISFQSSSWFASAFCDYYIRYGGEGKKFEVFCASAEEIIRRISGDLDQLGFSYIKDDQLEKMREIFQRNHISYYIIKKTRSVLYCGQGEGRADGKELGLIQGIADHYSDLSLWKEKSGDDEDVRKMRTVIHTNSDYLMQEVLKRTDLCNISPEHLSHREKSMYGDFKELGEKEQAISFVCLFRNDRSMEKNAKHFLGFIRQYISETL